MNLEFFLQPAQNGDGVVNGRLANHHGPETARERRIFFDMLLVLVERGGADAAQLAARQSGFQQIGGIDCALGGTGSHQGMQLIDEADDFAVGIDDLLDYSLEAVFELAAEFGAGDHAAEIDRHQLLIPELVGDIAADDPLRKPFDDGGFPYARLADQYRVILGAAAEHLHDAADFIVAADHGVELTLAGGLGEIVSVACQGLVLRFRILVRDTLRAADGDQRFQDGVVGGARAVQ